MKEKKRIPIRRRVQIAVLLTSIISLLLINLVGLFSMFRIRKLSEDALTVRTTQNVSDLANSKAELAEAELNSFAGTVNRLAEYIHGLYDSPERYQPREVLPPSSRNAGILVMQRGFLSEDIALSDVQGELELLGNTEQVFRPVMEGADGLVSTIYISTESGLMISYDAGSDVAGIEEGSEIYYNYKETIWYQQVIGADRAVFTPVYPDSYGQGLMITCGAPFYDAAGNKAGVICMNRHKAIYVLPPEYNMNGQIIFRDNMQIWLRGKNVLLLLASATTGATVAQAVESLEYYGATLTGISAIFSMATKIMGHPVHALFTPSDLPDYATYSPRDCALCKAGKHVDALCNGFGYTPIR